MSVPYDGQSTITASIPGITGGMRRWIRSKQFPLGIGLRATGKTQAALFDGSVTFNGAGATNVDLSVTGRIMSGDANGNGGLWVNSDQSLFVGADGNNIGFFSTRWGFGLTMSIDYGAITVRGSGADNVDLSVNGRIMSGDERNLGGLWVNSGQSMFVGAESGIM